MSLSRKAAVPLAATAPEITWENCPEQVTGPADRPAHVWTNFVTGDIFTAPHVLFTSGAACSGAEPVADHLRTGHSEVTDPPGLF